jgi:hypothetical protein
MQIIYLYRPENRTKCRPPGVRALFVGKYGVNYKVWQ